MEGLTDLATGTVPGTVTGGTGTPLDLGCPRDCPLAAWRRASWSTRTSATLVVVFLSVALQSELVSRSSDFCIATL